MRVINSLEELAPVYPAPVVTIGNFDGVHHGHQNLIRDLVARAKQIDGTPIVLTFDPHPLQVLAPNNAPLQIQTLNQKLAVIESLGIPLAVVIPFNMQLAQIGARDFAIQTLWDKLHFKEIYVGPNFAFGNRRQGSFSLLKEIGEERGFLACKIRQAQFRGSRVSSTIIRQALIAGQVGLARRLLDRPFALEGTVVRGTGLGTKMQVPTANLKTPNELIPRKGVYVTIFKMDGCRYESVTNIGFCPTVNQDEKAELSIEPHLLDFKQDLYGKEVILEFMVRLRDEHRFSDQEALIAQIHKDIANTRRYFRWLERKNFSL